MESLNGKVTGDQLTAAEFVQPMSELQNIITTSGQTLSALDVNQVRKALTYNVAGAAYFNASYDGSGDITLTALAGFADLIVLTDGMCIRFYSAVAAVTTTAPDLTIGAITKPLRDRGGANVPTGSVGAGVYVEAQYDLNADEWWLVSAGSGESMGSVIRATAFSVKETAISAGTEDHVITINSLASLRRRRVLTSDVVVTGTGAVTPVETVISGLDVVLTGSSSPATFYNIRYSFVTDSVTGTVADDLVVKLDFGTLTETVDMSAVTIKTPTSGVGVTASPDIQSIQGTGGVGAYKVSIYSTASTSGNLQWDIEVIAEATGDTLSLIIESGAVGDGSIKKGATVVAEVFV